MNGKSNKSNFFLNELPMNLNRDKVKFNFDWFKIIFPIKKIVSSWQM